MKKLSAVAVAAAMASSLFATDQVLAKDGVYTASSVGRNGAINVEVVIKNDKIASVKVLDWSETTPVADDARTKLLEDIGKHQSTEVDVISGATLSSFAIKDAVVKCIEKAGLDLSLIHI